MFYHVWLNVRCTTKPKIAHPMPSAKLATILNRAFKQNEVCYLFGVMLQGHDNKSKPGYPLIGLKLYVESRISNPRTIDDIAFNIMVRKA